MCLKTLLKKKLTNYTYTLTYTNSETGNANLKLQQSNEQNVLGQTHRMIYCIEIKALFLFYLSFKMQTIYIQRKQNIFIICKNNLA